MKKCSWNNMESTIGAAVFGVMGIGALAAAISGVGHQYAMAVICGVMAAALAIEAARDNRETIKRGLRHPSMAQKVRSLRLDAGCAKSPAPSRRS